MSTENHTKSHHHHVSINEREEILNDEYLHPEDGESHAQQPQQHIEGEGEGEGPSAVGVVQYEEDDDNAASATAADTPICAACHKSPSSYETFPCRCNKFCKKCAMRMATGGKCKTCHNLFASMTHLKK